MRVFVGVGSNTDQSHLRVEQAFEALKNQQQCLTIRSSSYYSTPALLPMDAPDEWNQIYCNAVFELEWSGSDPQSFLKTLKAIETSLGRQVGPRWSPREIDLDLLLFGEQVVQEPGLIVPHRELRSRSFVLDPLSELAPHLVPPGQLKTILMLKRELKTSQPSFMGVINVTPDSFSNSAKERGESAFVDQINQAITAHTHWIDIGAESTRPGAVAVSLEQEWSRLEPLLLHLAELKKTSIEFPKLSLDTYKAEIAQRGLQMGVDAINDVSGGRNPDMLSLIRQSKCQYICMHSLTVPAQKDVIIKSQSDPISEIRSWAHQKIEDFQRLNISLDRIILDPGIGFNKTSSQSLKIMQKIEQLHDLPVRILVGHSRKSFMSVFSHESSSERDLDSIGMSMHLGLKGVDIIRVHQAPLHQKAWIACQHLHPQ